MNNLNEKHKQRLVVLLETSEQLDLYQKHADRWRQYEPRLIAMTVYAAHACRERGLDFTSITEEGRYFTDEEYCMAQYESESVTISLLEGLDKIARPDEEGKSGEPYQLGHYFGYFIYLILGAYHTRAFILSKVLAGEQPDRILSFYLQGGSKDATNFRNSPIGHYSDLLKNSRHAEKMDVLEYGDSAPMSTPPQFKAIKKHVNEIFPGLFQWYFFWRRDIPFNLWHRFFPGSLRRALVLGAPYNWLTLMKEDIEHTGIIFDIWDTKAIPTGTGDGRKFANSINWQSDFHGFDMMPLMDQAFSSIERFRGEVEEYSKRIKIKLEKYDHVCASVIASPMQNIIAHFARLMGKPVYVWQHGSKGLHDGWPLMDELSELQFCTNYLAYGDAVAAYYRFYSDRYPHVKTVPVGSTNMEVHVSPPVKNGKRQTVLYATGKYILHNVPFAPPWADERLFHAQKTILAYLDEYVRLHPDVKVLFKRNNTPGYSAVPLVTKYVRMVGDEETFSSLMCDASLIILDSPGTTLVEVCASAKPVMALTNRVPFTPQALSSMRRRVVTAATPEELVEKIKRNLETGEYGADVNNREFVRGYGAHLDDGKAMERALDILRQVATKTGK